MEKNFSAALAHVLKSEGGFQDDPKDAGNKLPDGRQGCTNLGVTQSTWESFVGHPVSREDMKRLTEERVARLYRHKYWDAVKADELPDGVDYLVFDFAINAGPGRAIKLLQSVVGVPEDGAIGPKTLKAVESITPATIIQTYTEAKEEFYRSLNAFKVYGEGWLARTDTAEKTAYTLLG